MQSNVVLQQEWKQITMHELRKFITGTRRRFMAVVADDGGHTKY
jgi:hypothetical protein